MVERNTVNILTGVRFTLRANDKQCLCVNYAQTYL